VIRFATKAYCTVAVSGECTLIFKKTVQDKLYRVIFTKYYTTFSFDVCFILITYLKTVSCI